MSDLYEVAKSEMPQDLNMEIPLEKKQWAYINDINNGVYQNSTQTLVQFDLSSIYNSSDMIGVNEMFIALPMIYTGVWASNANQAVAPVAGNEFLITPKSGYYNLIQSVEVQVNGKSVIQNTPNINFHTNFKMLSTMSKDDLRTLGKTLGIHPDNILSYLFNGSGVGTINAFPIGGNGLCNNSIFPVNNAGVSSSVTIGAQNAVVALTAVPNDDQQSSCSAYASQGSVYNNALQYRSQRIAQNAIASANGFIGNNNQALFSKTNLNNEFRPYYDVVNANYMTWYDVAIIKLGHVIDFFNQCPLTKAFSALLRIYVNTGQLSIGVTKTQADNATASSGGYLFSASNSTFNNTCPIMINQLPVAQIPAINKGSLNVSCTIARANCSSAMGQGVAPLSNASHMMNACRCYYSMSTMKPSLALKYISENRAKKVIYNNVLSNVFTNIGAGQTYSALVQSGVRNIKGVLLIPFISQTTHGQNTAVPTLTTFAPYQSPFDSAPVTTPMSLTSLNVQVGGKNVIENGFYNYTYEDYLEQVNQYNNINGQDLGLSCGLLSQYMWEQGYRFYYINCSRANIADMNTPRNVTLTFLNNSQQSIDLWVFTEHLEECLLDVESGIISQ